VANNNNYAMLTGVARIGGTAYPSLQDAFDAVNADGQVVALIDNINENHGYQYSKAYSMTLDLCGYTIKATGSNNNESVSESKKDGGRAIKISNGSVTIKNGTIDGRSSGYPNGNSSSSSPWSLTRTGGAVRVSGGDCTLENLTLYNNDGWGNAVKLESNNHLIMRDCVINSVYGAGVEIGYGTADIYTCTFTQTGLAKNKYMSVCVAAYCLVTVNLYSTTTVVEATTTEETETIEEANYAAGTYAIYIYNSGAVVNIHGGQFVSSGEAVIQCDGATFEGFHNENEGTTEGDQAIFDAFINAHNGKSSVIQVYGGSFSGKVSKGGTTSMADINVYDGSFTVDISQYKK